MNIPGFLSFRYLLEWCFQNTVLVFFLSQSCSRYLFPVLLLFWVVYTHNGIWNDKKLLKGELNISITGEKERKNIYTENISLYLSFCLLKKKEEGFKVSKTTMSAAFLCYGICISDVIEPTCRAKVSNISWASLFLLFTGKDKKQQYCALRSSFKTKSHQVFVIIDRKCRLDKNICKKMETGWKCLHCFCVFRPACFQSGFLLNLSASISEWPQSTRQLRIICLLSLMNKFTWWSILWWTLCITHRVHNAIN